MDLLVARAPVRIDFGGGWTDVPPYSEEQGGCVCNVAIALHATVRLERVVPEGGARRGTQSVAELTGENALAAAALRRAGLPDVRATLEAGFPLGAGLGGSSAAGVAVTGALDAWRGLPIDPARIAEASRRLEVEDLGIAGGRQDHYAAAFGGALGLWFGHGTRVRRLGLAAETVSALERRTIVIYTGQSRISADTINAVLEAYRARLPRVVAALRRMKALAEQMVEMLERGDLDGLAAAVGEHWIHQRALHPAITTPRIDAILDRAMRAGAGGKALGASGGGCVVLVAPEDRVERVRDAVLELGALLPVRVDTAGFRVETPASEPATA